VLPPGLLVSGKITKPDTTPMPSTVVEILPGDGSSDVPITTGVTRAQGDYTVYLPDPGNIIVDGGTD
jgi:hypothetical protein